MSQFAPLPSSESDPHDSPLDNRERRQEDLLSGSEAQFSSVTSFAFRYPHLSSALYGDRGAPDETPLTGRNWTREMLFSEYERMIDRRFFHYHCPEPIPFASSSARKKGERMLRNEEEFEKFISDTDGELEYALLQNANEKAFEHAVAAPVRLAGAGRLAEALAAFGQALDAAPGRQSEIYVTLARFALTAQELKERGQGVVPMMGLDNPFHFAAEQSPLMNDVIVPEDAAGTRMRYGYSIGRLRGTREAFAAAFDPAAIRESVSASELPFREIAREAYRRALETLEKRAGQPDHFAGQRLALRHRIETCLALLDDDPATREQALSRVLHANGDCPLLASADGSAVLNALRGSGQYDRGILACARALNAEDAPGDENLALALMSFCEIRARQTGENLWNLARPHTEAPLEEAFEQLTPSMYFSNGLVLEGLGRGGEAREEYSEALYELEDMRTRCARYGADQKEYFDTQEKIIREKLNSLSRG